MYTSKKKLTKKQMIFMVEVIVTGLVDMVESAGPLSISYNDRCRMTNNKPGKLTSEEKSAIILTGISLSIFCAQVTGGGCEVGDALSMAGNLDQRIADFMAACWKSKGKHIKREPGKISDILPKYPDAHKIAKKFVKAMLEYAEDVRQRVD